MPSPEYLSFLADFTGLPLLIFCWVLVWLPLVQSSGYDCFYRSKWRFVRLLEKWLYSGRYGQADKPGLGVAFVGPFVLWYGIGYVLSVTIPMTLTWISQDDVSQTYSAQRVSDPFRGAQRLMLSPANWWVDGVRYPPSQIVEQVRPGDAVLLTGSGNGWGVFYSKMELIKQE